MAMRLLIAEDDDATAVPIERALGRLGYAVVRAASGKDAYDLGATSRFDVIVLDRMLPEIDGIEILRRWRAADNHTPVILLTALGGIADRVEGFDAGADDYLVKPFAFEELAARITALARRPPLAMSQTHFIVGDVTLDLLRREVHRAGKAVLLQPREFALLEQLMRNAGSVVTRTMFLETVWGFHFDPQTNLVESHLSRLRSKLKLTSKIDPIETVRGVGYRMRAIE